MSKYAIDKLREAARNEQTVLSLNKLLNLKNAELAALKAENESLLKELEFQRNAHNQAQELLLEQGKEIDELRRDAEQWRAYQKRKQDLLDRGFLRSPLREEAELNPAMAQGDKG